MKFKRIFVIVADSLGVGALPDADKYGDVGTNTLSHLSYSKSDFTIPTLESMGIGNITDINNTPKTIKPKASYGYMSEKSIGKDTLTGHWEIMGLKVLKPFPSFTDTGFPKELINEIIDKTGHGVIGNCSASGTKIIEELGEEHLKTKDLIIYTSADSVLQIAAHEEVVPLSELYKICEIVRKITLDNEQWMVGRIIARPFIGTNKSNFKRTTNRHDYAVKPFAKTVLVYLKERNYDVLSVGKIRDIFDGEGITSSNPIKSNLDGMNITCEIAKKEFTGLCFVNLVDFDALYGHRRLPLEYAKAVEEFDGCIKQLITLIKKDDLLIITADHGNDPTHSGTDHTREYTPLLAYTTKEVGVNLGKRSTFADIGATIAENFGLPAPAIGESFLKLIKVED